MRHPRGAFSALLRILASLSYPPTPPSPSLKWYLIGKVIQRLSELFLWLRYQEGFQGVFSFCHTQSFPLCICRKKTKRCPLLSP